MATCVGFKAVSRPDARVLVLGTLPGVESLKHQQYYAKPQNSFWRIMGDLVGAFPQLPYEERLKQLMENKIALWDVCATAERKGSLDSNIQSEQVNDFVSFFEKNEHIAMICFNGQSAEKKFRDYVLPKISGREFDLRTLPSTSSAYAGMRYEKKLSLWREELSKFIEPKNAIINAS